MTIASEESGESVTELEIGGYRVMTDTCPTVVQGWEPLRPLPKSDFGNLMKTPIRRWDSIRRDWIPADLAGRRLAGRSEGSAACTALSNPAGGGASDDRR